MCILMIQEYLKVTNTKNQKTKYQWSMFMYVIEKVQDGITVIVETNEWNTIRLVCNDTNTIDIPFTTHNNISYRRWKRNPLHAFNVINEWEKIYNTRISDVRFIKQ